MRIFPRPVSPRSAFADLKMMFSSERPHRWGLLGLSTAITFVILWGFWLDARGPEPQREIFYVESWMNDRKDSDIIRRQQADLANYEATLQKKQKEFQKVADLVGIEWRKEEAENRARREAINAAMAKQLNRKLAEAEAREATQAAAGTARDAGEAPVTQAP